MTRPDIEVVHVGSACRDIAPEDPRGWRIGGGVMYAALTTARLGLRTAAVVGVDTEAADAAELTMLGEAGVDILRVDLSEGPIYHNLETKNGRVQTCVQPGVPLPLADLPPAWMAAPGWSVVPVAGEVRDDWARVIPADAHVAVAWQGFLRDLRAGEQVRGLRAASIADPRARRSHRRQPPRRSAGRPAAGPGATAGPGSRPAGHRGRRGRSPDPARPGRPAGDAALPPAGQRRRSRSHRGRGHVPRRAPRLRDPGGHRGARVARARRCAGRSATGWTCGSPRPQARWSWRIGVWMACRTWRPSRPVLERDAAPGTVIAIPTEDAIRFWSEGPPAA